MFQGIDLPDQSVYLFQARVLLNGHLTADAPPATIIQTPAWLKAFSFDHHIIYKDMWFGKYPPGWPSILALGVGSHAERFVNPLIGLLVLFVTQHIAKLVFCESVANLALWFLIASPYFLMNFLGYMSASCLHLAAHSGYLADLSWSQGTGLQTSTGRSFSCRRLLGSTLYYGLCGLCPL